MVAQRKAHEWALILGGSSGLGLATAKKLARHGYNIAIVHRDRRKDVAQLETEIATMTANGVRCERYNIDATNTDKRKTTIAQLQELLQDQRIKILVHSIARGNFKPMWDAQNVATLTNQDLHLTLDAMAVSCYDWTRMLVAHKLFAPDARVIAFTSEGNQRAWPQYGAISAAKAALEAMVRNMALEFAPIGIKVNCIQAGVTDTKALRHIPGHETLMQKALERNPNQRLTTPEDVANAVYLLCLEEAKWITGTILKVDGGESLR